MLMAVMPAIRAMLLVVLVMSRAPCKVVGVAFARRVSASRPTPSLQQEACQLPSDAWKHRDIGSTTGSQGRRGIGSGVREACPRGETTRTSKRLDEDVEPPLVHPRNSARRAAWDATDNGTWAAGVALPAAGADDEHPYERSHHNNAGDDAVESGHRDLAAGIDDTHLRGPGLFQGGPSPRASCGGATAHHNGTAAPEFTLWTRILKAVLRRMHVAAR